MTTMSIEPGEIDLARVCRLDDVQPFYREALERYVHMSALRFVGILTILQAQGSQIADAILAHQANVATTTRLFLQYRELDAAAQSLVRAYTSKNTASITGWLQAIGALLMPFSGGLAPDLMLFDQTRIPAQTIVHYPTAATIVRTQTETTLPQLSERITGLLHPLRAPLTGDTLRPDTYTHGGIRLSLAASQPSAAGQEFQFMEQGELPTEAAVQRVCNAINSLAHIDIGLSVSLHDIMTLFTLCPRLPHMRQAGSVSSLPGWAWQDSDLTVDPLLEYAHLCVQMTHEFFHTKLNLVEKSIRLYEGDGNHPEVFSPWKERMRPLRQVMHALMTFSAGAAVWARLAQLNLLTTTEVIETAEAYWKENLAFAEIGLKGLRASGTLTAAGTLLVDACNEHLITVIAAVTAC